MPGHNRHAPAPVGAPFTRCPISCGFVRGSGEIVMTKMPFAVAMLAASLIVACSRPSVSACYPHDGLAQAALGSLRRMSLASSGTDSALREHAKLPWLTDTAQIYQVLDSATCARAVEPHNDHAGYSPGVRRTERTQRVYLFRVGEAWVTTNYHAIVGGGEWTPHFVMDSTYRMIGSYMY